MKLKTVEEKKESKLQSQRQYRQKKKEERQLTKEQDNIKIEQHIIFQPQDNINFTSLSIEEFRIKYINTSNLVLIRGFNFPDKIKFADTFYRYHKQIFYKGCTKESIHECINNVINLLKTNNKVIVLNPFELLSELEHYKDLSDNLEIIKLVDDIDSLDKKIYDMYYESNCGELVVKFDFMNAKGLVY